MRSRKNPARVSSSPLMRPKRRIFFWIVLIALVAAGGWWFVARRGSAASSPSGGPPGRQGRGSFGGGPVPVIAGEVKKQDVPIWLDGIGTVQAFNTVTVRARVDGEIQQVAFSEGQDVKAGDLLAVIDPRPLQAALAQAEAKKKQDEALAANARAVLARNTDLLQKKVLDQQTFDNSKYTADQLAAQVQADQAAIEAAQVQLAYTRITAPIAGRTGVRLVDQGNVVRASDQTGIVVITQLKPITVVFTLPEANLRAIRERQAAAPDEPVKVVALDRSNTSNLAEGTLTVVDNQIDQTTGTIRLKATFANEDLRLWPGQFINARLLVDTKKGGLIVPATVIQRGPQGSYAYVIKPDMTAEMRPVTVAQTEDGMALVDKGLNEGERVVVDGQYKLQPGGKVEISGAGRQGGRPGGNDGGKPGEQGMKPEGEAKKSPPGEGASEGTERRGRRSREGGGTPEPSKSPAS